MMFPSTVRPDWADETTVSDRPHAHMSSYYLKAVGPPLESSRPATARGCSGPINCSDAVQGDPVPDGAVQLPVDGSHVIAHALGCARQIAG
jgi:hypothetical protein